jgi:hypothetical protein
MPKNTTFYHPSSLSTSASHHQTASQAETHSHPDPRTSYSWTHPGQNTHIGVAGDQHIAESIGTWRDCPWKLGLWLGDWDGSLLWWWFAGKAYSFLGIFDWRGRWVGKEFLRNFPKLEDWLWSRGEWPGLLLLWYRIDESDHFRKIYNSKKVCCTYDWTRISDSTSSLVSSCGMKDPSMYRWCSPWPESFTTIYFGNSVAT